MKRDKATRLAQATLEYVIISLLLATFVFAGFLANRPGVDEPGGRAPGSRRYNFVESCRIKLQEFTGRATHRINNEPDAAFH